MSVSVHATVRATSRCVSSMPPCLTLWRPTPQPRLRTAPACTRRVGDPSGQLAIRHVWSIMRLTTSVRSERRLASRQRASRPPSGEGKPRHACPRVYGGEVPCAFSAQLFSAQLTVLPVECARSLSESGDSARRLLRESVSEGASGSFFYWVKYPDGSDTGFLVKQITEREKNTLMSILPAYKEHVQAQGGSSLLQYLSCHSKIMDWELAGKVYFVVMRNFFPIRPQLSFDLKGATANRRALKTWELHQTNTVAGLYSTLRDWEWMDIGMTTDLEESDKGSIWSMVSADCEFLHQQQLLDYSLLLGIYRPPATLHSQQKQALLRQLAAQCRGTGVVSRDRQKVYFFGMIDVLEKFTIRWRIQRACLRLLYALSMRWYSSDGISAMPPNLYADRFRTFVAHEVLQMEEEPAQAALDEQWRAGSCAQLCRRLWGLPSRERGARRGGKARWKPLWERRRRGLVKQRMDSESEDQIARIKGTSPGSIHCRRPLCRFAALRCGALPGRRPHCPHVYTVSCAGRLCWPQNSRTT